MRFGAKFVASEVLTALLSTNNFSVVACSVRVRFYFEVHHQAVPPFENEAKHNPDAWAIRFMQRLANGSDSQGRETATDDRFGAGEVKRGEAR